MKSIVLVLLFFVAVPVGFTKPIISSNTTIVYICDNPLCPECTSPHIKHITASLQRSGASVKLIQSENHTKTFIDMMRGECYVFTLPLFTVWRAGRLVYTQQGGDQQEFESCGPK